MKHYSTWRKLLISLPVVAFVTIACGQTGGDGQSANVRFAHPLETGHPYQQCGAEPLAEQLEENNTGIDMELFPAGQLGDEAELLEQLVANNLEMAIINSSFLAEYHEPLTVMSAAYAFRDTDHLLEVSNGEIGQEMWDAVLEEANVRVIGTWYYGSRELTANQPVTSPADLQGVRVRAPDVAIWLANIEAMGGSPIPMALSELYLGLQQGTVDAQENPVPTIELNNYYEVQDYLSLTEHVLQANQIVVAEPIWQSLSSEQQEALQEAVDSVSDEVRECIESETEETLERWRAENTIEIVEDIDIEAFSSEARETLPERFEDQWGEGLYERIQDA